MPFWAQVGSMWAVLGTILVPVGAHVLGTIFGAFLGPRALYVGCFGDHFGACWGSDQHVTTAPEPL